jgi:hypothetical protein
MAFRFHGSMAIGEPFVSKSFALQSLASSTPKIEIPFRISANRLPYVRAHARDKLQ